MTEPRVRVESEQARARAGTARCATGGLLDRVLLEGAHEDDGMHLARVVGVGARFADGLA
jgi:hypothetical protein